MTDEYNEDFAKSPLLFCALIGVLQGVAQGIFLVVDVDYGIQQKVTIYIAKAMFFVPVGIVAINLLIRLGILFAVILFPGIVKEK